MLKTPALIDPPRNPLLPQTGEIGRMKHADFDSLRAMFRNQRGEKRRAGRIGRFASTSQGVR